MQSLLLVDSIYAQISVFQSCDFDFRTSEALRSPNVVSYSSYNFDVQKGNLTSRKDHATGIQEEFIYDNLNCLTGYGSNRAAYDIKGNIMLKSDIGSIFFYNLSGKPYAITGVGAKDNTIPLCNQSVTHTSFKRPNTITEGNYSASFVYNDEGVRVKMEVKKNGTKELTRYYLGNQYELDEGVAGTKEKLYLGGDYYSAPVVYVKEGTGNWQVYNICRDYLGSITHIVNSGGTVVQQLSYDAWGRLRNPANQTVYAPDAEPALFLGRGYTGHEHLTMFGLVNMNARLYDPAVGRFLSPDPFVQLPDFSQNFNRYSYALNNPLSYTDPTGEFIFGYAAGFFRGLFSGKNPFKEGWKGGVNEVKIWGGMFASDPNKNFGERLWEVTSRVAWQLPQTLAGLGYSNI